MQCNCAFRSGQILVLASFFHSGLGEKWRDFAKDSSCHTRHGGGEGECRLFAAQNSCKVIDGAAVMENRLQRIGQIFGGKARQSTGKLAKACTGWRQYFYAGLQNSGK